jgi:hypothetical protein
LGFPMLASALWAGEPSLQGEYCVIVHRVLRFYSRLPKQSKQIVQILKKIFYVKSITYNLTISGRSELKTLGLSEMADNVRLMDSVRKLRLEGAGL